MKAWKLPRLMMANRNAMTVYAALRWLAGDKRQWNGTRARISAVCRIRDLDTISAAVGALADARWIALNYDRDGRRQWYRITFPVPDFFPVPENIRHRDARLNRKNPAQGTVRCTRKNRAHSHKGVGAVPDHAPASNFGDVAPAPQPPLIPLRPHPADVAEDHLREQFRRGRAGGVA